MRKFSSLHSIHLIRSHTRTRIFHTVCLYSTCLSRSCFLWLSPIRVQFEVNSRCNFDIFQNYSPVHGVLQVVKIKYYSLTYSALESPEWPLQLCLRGPSLSSSYRENRRSFSESKRTEKTDCPWPPWCYRNTWFHHSSFPDIFRNKIWLTRSLTFHVMQHTLSIRSGIFLTRHSYEGIDALPNPTTLWRGLRKCT